MSEIQTKVWDSKTFRFLDIIYTDDRVRKLTMWKTLSDIIFLIVVVGIPSSFFGFINEETFYIKGYFDLRLLAWLATLPFLFLYIRNLKYIKNIVAGKFLLLVVIFVITNFLFTLIMGISFSEAFKAFRVDYFSPISCLALLLYGYSMSLRRLHRFLKWILIVTILQGIFYIIDLTTGFSIFAVSVYRVEYWQGALIERNYLAFPMVNTMVFTLALVGLLYERKKIWIIPLAISSMCVLIGSFRHLLFECISIIFIQLIMYIFFEKKKGISRVMLMLVVFIVIVMIFQLAFSEYYGYFFDRISEIIRNGKLDLKGIPNFSLRINLITETWKNGIEKGTLFFGNGYVRSRNPGEYDLVFGGDTHIAPILYTEGIFGIVIRIIPILILFFYNFRCYLRGQKSISSALNLISISWIFSQFIGFVQSPILRNYNSVFFFLMIFEFIKIKYRSVIIESINEDSYVK